jgi:hypothetical protein
MGSFSRVQSPIEHVAAQEHARTASDRSAVDAASFTDAKLVQSDAVPDPVAFLPRAGDDTAIESGCYAVRKDCNDGQR